MKIAVVIPIYNQAAYLRRCLGSLAAQTDGDFTAICVNDGSTDASQEIIDEYVARDPRFLSVRKPNGGLSSARNAGMAAADRLGGFDALMFLDSDDFFHPQCLEAVRRAAAAHPGAVVEYRFTSAPSPDGFAACRYDLSAVALEEDAVSDTVWNKLYPRAILGDLRFDEAVRYSEDVVFTTVLRLKVRPKFWRIPLDLHYYTDNPDSMTRVRFDAENFRRRSVTVEALVRAFADDPKGLGELTHGSLPSLLKRYYRDLRKNVRPDAAAEARQVFAEELASLRRRGLLHRDRESFKDIKYHWTFVYLAHRYGSTGPQGRKARA